MAVPAGTSNLYLSRDTKVYIEQAGVIWEIPVLNGYSVNQTTNTSEVTLNEMSDSTGRSRRARKVFTDSVAPSEWSLTTYMRPVTVSGVTRAVEEVLWANFVAPNAFDGTAWDAGVDIAADALTFDFEDSNKTTIGEFNLYFVFGAANAPDANYEADGDTLIYRVPGSVINEAAITFDIDGIASIAWSGMGATRVEVGAFDASTAIRAGIDDDDNFIRNRLTQVSLVSSVSGSSKTYNVTLTGGSITISNNLTFLTPEVMGRVNRPLGHVTGTRTVTGNMTAYMDEQTNGTVDLTDDISNAINTVTNKFAVDFYVGGKDTGDNPVGPGVQFKIPQAHLSVPSFDIGDVLAVDITFDGLPSTLSSADEISVIKYVAA